MSDEDVVGAGRAVDHRNEVLLVGRLGAVPEPRALPSGDEIVTFRVVVDRPSRGRHQTGRREPTVDTLDCAVATSVLRKRLLGWSAGDVVEVRGSLRRRFWRAGPAVLSRCEVQVVRAKRLVRAA